MYMSKRSGKNNLHRKKKKKDYKLLLMALPFVLLIFIFKYIPLAGWSIAFFDYKLGRGLNEVPFVGFKYFIVLIKDLDYLAPILLNTVVMSILLLLNTWAAIVLAILLNEIRSARFKKITQTITTLPNFISMVIVYSMAFAMFSYSGSVNVLLTNVGILDKPLNVLGNQEMAWFIQMGMHLWKTTGWNSIIYLAAIAGIDQQLYDAVAVDGGGRFRKIWHITIPGLLPTFLVLTLLNISHLFNNGGLWEQVFVFMNPMVQDKLEILSYYIYRMGIISGNYSYATSLELLNSLLSLILLFAMNHMSKKIRGESII